MVWKPGQKCGFTLIEMLVVIAVVAVLAAVVFPVLVAARAQAKASVCLNNFRQVTFASLIYLNDYDDRFPLSRHTSRLEATSAEDQTWVQLVLPYSTSFDLYKCPSDFTKRPESQAVFDADLAPGETYARFYSDSKRTNLGYNYLYLSPLTIDDATIFPGSRMQTEIGDPANMLIFGDSVYEVDERGNPKGGGSYLIVPPCRYKQVGMTIEDTFRLNGLPESSIYSGTLSWDDPVTADPKKALERGGLWPWHRNHLTATFADGHARRITIQRVTEGCTVKPDWAGLIHDQGQYVWDLE